MWLSSSSEHQYSQSLSNASSAFSWPAPARRRRSPAAAGDETQRPHRQQTEKRHWPVHREKPLPPAVVADACRYGAPRLPGEAEIGPRESEAPRHGPRQDDGFECVPERGGDEDETDQKRRDSHG